MLMVTREGATDATSRRIEDGVSVVIAEKTTDIPDQQR